MTINWLHLDMYRAAVNNEEFQVMETEAGLSIDGELIDWDLVQLSPGYYHIIFRNKSYRAEMVKADPGSKSFTIRINGRNYFVRLKDKLDLLLEKMGMNNSGAGKLNTIRAPMPGLIIDLKIKSGDSVRTGDPLLILEAMKMENVLKSPGDGTVKTVKVKKGDSVEKGEVLIEF